MAEPRSPNSNLLGPEDALPALLGTGGVIPTALNELPVGLYMTDTTGRITYCNDAAVTLWGRRPLTDEQEAAGPWELYSPEGLRLAPSEYPAARALKERKPVRGTELVVERSDGSRIRVLPRSSLLFDATGEIVSALILLVDLAPTTQRQRAEAELAAIVASSRDGIIGVDLHGTITSWNAGATRMFGYAAEEMLGQSIVRLIPEDHRTEEISVMARVANDEHVEPYETVRLRRDGNLLPVSVAMSPIKGMNGSVVGASRITRDITDQKRAQDFQALMLGEMKHRVKNLLTVIEALGRGSRPKNNRELDEFWKAFMGRVRVLLSAGEFVFETANRSGDLKRVAEITLAPFRDPGASERIVIEGPSVDLAEHTIGGLALAFHELATNALKYGALSHPGGAAVLAWRVANKRIEIEWKERSTRPIVPPATSGFGRRVIEAVATNERDSSVTLDFEPDGLRCRFAFSLAD